MSESDVNSGSKRSSPTEEPLSSNLSNTKDEGTPQLNKLKPYILPTARTAMAPSPVLTDSTTMSLILEALIPKLVHAFFGLPISNLANLSDLTLVRETHILFTLGEFVLSSYHNFSNPLFSFDLGPATYRIN